MMVPGIIENLGWIVCASTLVVLVADRLRIPSIVAYIIAGLMLGPILGLIEVTHSVELIGEVGIALLLFVVGLELSLDHIRDVGKVAVVAGVTQVAVSVAGGFGLSFLLGYGSLEALMLGIAVTFSSTVVVVKLVDQRGELDALYGRIAVGILLVQDIVVVLSLTVLAGASEGGGELAVGQLLGSIGFALGGTALLMIAALAASRWLLPRPMGWAARSAETLFMWSLGWFFVFVLVSYVLGLSLEIGAFLAGLSLAQLPYSEELKRRVHPLMSFFVAIFFVTLGLQVDLSSARQGLVVAAVLSVFVMVGKFLVFMVMVSRQGYGERTTFKTAISLAQISEFGFIFAAMALSAGMIGKEVLSIVAVVGLATIAISSFLIQYSDQLYRLAHTSGLLKIFGAGGRPDEEGGRHGPSDHVIVVGMNPLGRELVRRLEASGQAVVAVDTDAAKLRDLPAETVLGNVEHPSVFEEAGLEHARAVISALHIDDTNRLIAIKARRVGIPVAIHAFDGALRSELEALEVDYLITPRADAVAQEWERLRQSLDIGRGEQRDEEPGHA
ncbi:portal protein [Lujinxingia litoralis]|uniref:Portal protein n=1 Tax=Lujinxingia litoralis TaxID=2211119 RepID=A0A328CDZ6_9DELT|nr:cation:proton antiporter [Lujinxingia litoralis]RAL25299.1 portal protein [Lujinxingia litoralis]